MLNKFLNEYFFAFFSKKLDGTVQVYIFIENYKTRYSTKTGVC